MARISVNGIAREVYTQCRTPVDKWDTAKGRATGRDKLAYEANAYIDDFRAKVVEIYRTLQAKASKATVYFLPIAFKYRILNNLLQDMKNFRG